MLFEAPKEVKQNFKPLDERRGHCPRCRRVVGGTVSVALLKWPLRCHFLGVQLGLKVDIGGFLIWLGMVSAPFGDIATVAALILAWHFARLPRKLPVTTSLGQEIPLWKLVDDTQTTPISEAVRFSVLGMVHRGLTALSVIGTIFGGLVVSDVGMGYLLGVGAVSGFDAVYQVWLLSHVGGWIISIVVYLRVRTGLAVMSRLSKLLRR